MHAHLRASVIKILFHRRHNNHQEDSIIKSTTAMTPFYRKTQQLDLHDKEAPRNWHTIAGTIRAPETEGSSLHVAEKTTLSPIELKRIAISTHFVWEQLLAGTLTARVYEKE